MFCDDVLPFDVVEVPVPKRNGFHTRTKNQNRSILVRSQFVHHSESAAYSVMNLNSYHVMHPAANSS